MLSKNICVIAVLAMLANSHAFDAEKIMDKYKLGRHHHPHMGQLWMGHHNMGQLGLGHDGHDHHHDGDHHDGDHHHHDGHHHDGDHHHGACVTVEFYTGAGCVGEAVHESTHRVHDDVGSPCEDHDGNSAKDNYCAADGYHVTIYENSKTCSGEGKDIVFMTGECKAAGDDHSMAVFCAKSGCEKSHMENSVA